MKNTAVHRESSSTCVTLRYNCHDPALQFRTGQHYDSLTGGTLNTDIRPGTQHLPFIATTGMFLLQADDIVKLQVHRAAVYLLPN